LLIPNDTEEDRAADVECDMLLGNGIEDLECPAQWNVTAPPNYPRLIWPALKSKRQVEKVFVTVNAIETRRNKGVKKQ